MTEYQKKQAEFEARTDALCEHTPPMECDCSKCPCQELCYWLCAHDPG